MLRGTLMNALALRRRCHTILAGRAAPALLIAAMLTWGAAAQAGGTPADTTPDPFYFVDRTDVATSTVITSAAVTIRGINREAPISVTGGMYSIGCKATSFRSTPSKIENGEKVCVRHTSAATPSTAVNTTLTVGGVSDTFTSTTAAPAADSTPNAFHFDDQNPVALSVPVTSTAVAITGINVATPIAVSGGQYSIGCTASFTGASDNITNNQVVCVKHTSSAALSTPVDTVLTVGGVSDTFTSTTLSDATPDPFTFIGQIPVPLVTPITSNTVTITGITGPVAISVTDGQYSIGCTASFTGAAGTISNGQSVCVRHTSAATENSSVGTILDVGGVRDTFTSVTEITSASVDTATLPADTPEVDPEVTLDFPNQGLKTVTETDATDKPGTIAVTSCAPVDPREGEGPGGAFNPRPLALSELASTCPTLPLETLVIPPYVRGFPDVNGDVRFVISTASTTAEFTDAMLLHQGQPETLVDYGTGTHPPCEAPLSDRPLWFYGMRVGERVALVGEDSVMKPSSIQCNQSRSGTKKMSNLLQASRLDEGLYTSKSYVADQIRDLDTLLTKLAFDDGSCDAALGDATATMQTALASCRMATVFANITQDTSVPAVAITRTIYEYQMLVTLTNPGAIANDASVKIRSGKPATTTVVGTNDEVVVNFGTIPAGATTAATTFRIRQNRTVPLNPKDLLAAVSFADDDPGRYSNARAACEQICSVAKANKAAFASCPDKVKEKNYRGALISGGLATGFSIFDRLEHPTTSPPGAWTRYPVELTGCVDEGQIPTD